MIPENKYRHLGLPHVGSATRTRLPASTWRKICEERTQELIYLIRQYSVGGREPGIRAHLRADHVMNAFQNTMTVALVFLLPGRGVCQSVASDFEKADREVLRLSPSEFPRLPKAIRRELTHRGCGIPQVWGDKKPHNVIQGRFIRKDELDWAVLCSVNRVSGILVFRKESPSLFSELAREADINILQSGSDGDIGYSRGISAVGREIIERDYRAFGGTRPPFIDHEGIEDAFVGKASIIFYLHRGKWLKLTGSD